MTFNIHTINLLRFLAMVSTTNQRTHNCCLHLQQEVTYLDGANLKKKRM